MDRSTGSLVNEGETNDRQDTKLAAGHSQPTRFAPKDLNLSFQDCGKNNPHNVDLGILTNIQEVDVIKVKISIHILTFNVDGVSIHPNTQWVANVYSI